MHLATPVNFRSSNARQNFDLFENRNRTVASRDVDGLSSGGAMTVAPRVRAERCALRESELNRDPSFGGWPGYEPWFRQIVVGLSIHPNDTMTTPSGNPHPPPSKKRFRAPRRSSDDVVPRFFRLFCGQSISNPQYLDVPTVKQFTLNSYLNKNKTNARHCHTTACSHPLRTHETRHDHHLRLRQEQELGGA